MKEQQISFALKVNGKNIKNTMKSVERLKEILKGLYEADIVFQDNETLEILNEYSGRADKCSATLVIGFDENDIRQKKQRNAGRKERVVYFTDSDGARKVFTIGKYLEFAETMHDYEICKLTDIKTSRFRDRKARMLKKLKDNSLEEIKDLEF